MKHRGTRETRRVREGDVQGDAEGSAEGCAGLTLGRGPDEIRLLDGSGIVERGTVGPVGEAVSGGSVVEGKAARDQQGGAQAR